MPPTSRRERQELIRLHTDAAGFVWYGEEGVPAVNSYLEPADFLTSEHFDPVLTRRVRLVGCRANAALVVGLYEYRVRAVDRGFAVELVSPELCPTAAVRADPAAVLKTVWQPGAAAPLAGQLHVMGERDYCSYAVACHLDRGGHVSEHVRRCALYHPAWPAFSFVRGLDPAAACRLIAAVLDPRWFRHRLRPGRLSRLEAYLGLTPANAVAYLDNAHERAYHYDHAATAFSVWFSGGPPQDQAGEQPGYFLWRIAAAARSATAGLLAATRKLIRLVVGVWEAELPPAHPEAAFLPEAFFREAELALAFRHHLSDPGVAKKV